MFFTKEDKAFIKIGKLMSGFPDKGRKGSGLDNLITKLL